MSPMVAGGGGWEWLEGVREDNQITPPILTPLQHQTIQIFLGGEFVKNHLILVLFISYYHTILVLLTNAIAEPDNPSVFWCKGRLLSPNQALTRAHRVRPRKFEIPFFSWIHEHCTMKNLPGREVPVYLFCWVVVKSLKHGFGSAGW